MAAVALSVRHGGPLPGSQVPQSEQGQLEAVLYARLSNRRERYTLTVPSETIRVAAISLFFRPCDSRLTNCPSRFVRTTRRAFRKLSVRAFSNHNSPA